MLIHLLTYITVGFLISILGALPFGLVNLSVLDASLRHGKHAAMGMAHGAALVEVLFGLTALMSGVFLQKYLEGNLYVQYSSIILISIVGLTFFIKKETPDLSINRNDRSFFKGIFLNLISIQVFLFWIFAIAILSSKSVMPTNFYYLFGFVFGILLGKIAVLTLYVLLSNTIVGKFKNVSRYMNQIIGIVLFISAAVQAVKL